MSTNAKILIVPIDGDWPKRAGSVADGLLVGMGRSEEEVDAARAAAEAGGFNNCMFVVGQLEEIPWQDGMFDRAVLGELPSERGAWELSRVMVSRGAHLEGPEGMVERMQAYGFTAAPRRFLIVTFGSFGDLHPFLAIAIGLRARGHQVTLASSEFYREKVESEGVEFLSVPPDIGLLEHDMEARRRSMAKFSGTKYVIQTLVLPGLEEGFRLLEPVAKQADVLLGSPLAFALPMLGEKYGKPWVSGPLQPTMMMSVEDQPVLPIAPWVRGLGEWGKPVFRTLKEGAMRVSWKFLEPVTRLRASLGLSTDKHPIFESFSPVANLALFSRHFAEPAADWPTPMTMCGFPFYDKWSGGDQAELESGLEEFLAAGEAPVVFTLGTSAVMDPGAFYDEAAKAITAMGARAVFLVGRTSLAQFQKLATARIHVCAYAAHSLLMPRASVNVHQGGIGTMGQALRAGKPMIVVPYSHDQPDNAARAVRLGVGLTIGRGAYNARRLRQTLEKVGACAAKAAEIGAAIRSEDAVAQACDVLEKVAATQPSTLGR